MNSDITFCAMPRDCKVQDTCRRGNWKSIYEGNTVSMAEMYEFTQSGECVNYYPGEKNG